MPESSRFNLSFSLLSLMVLFRPQSPKSKSKSNSSSPSSSSCSPDNSPELYSSIDPSFSPSSSSSPMETNKVIKKSSWPKKIRNKLKKVFVVNHNKSTKNKKKSRSTSSDQYDNGSLASTSSPSTNFYHHEPKSSVRFSPVCVIIDENSRPCGHKPLKLEPNYTNYFNNNNNGQVNFEFRREYVKMQRDFFRHLDELENNEDEIVEGDYLFELNIKEQRAY